MAPGGYAWWYVDALSDDGRHGLTIIGFVGSVFSPYYAWARRREPLTPALDHCALNVALYTLDGPRVSGRWAMTERGRSHVARTSDSLQIGPSAMRWDRDTLCIDIDEVCVPWPSRLRGTVRVSPEVLLNQSYTLDADGRHRWSPIAPMANVEVDLSQPGLRWRGTGYLDSNHGDRPLERDFERWDWSRVALAAGRSAVLYDVTRQGGIEHTLALSFDADGTAYHFEPPPPAELPATRWRVKRGTRCEPSSAAHVLHTLEDAPFYARSVVASAWLKQPVTTVHESLSLDRFDTAIVRCMLPFRMPRVGD